MNVRKLLLGAVGAVAVALGVMSPDVDAQAFTSALLAVAAAAWAVTEFVRRDVFPRLDGVAVMGVSVIAGVVLSVALAYGRVLDVTAGGWLAWVLFGIAAGVTATVGVDKVAQAIEGREHDPKGLTP